MNKSMTLVSLLCCVLLCLCFSLHQCFLSYSGKHWTAVSWFYLLSGLSSFSDAVRLIYNFWLGCIFEGNKQCNCSTRVLQTGIL